MAVAAIRISQLTKDYGGGRGVFGLDLEVAPGEVFGLVGPAAAGKTTTVRCITSLVRPTSGSVFVFGIDCRRDAVDAVRKIGYLPGEMPAFDALRGDEVVTYLGGMRGRIDEQRLGSLVERFQLDLRARFRDMATGDKRKLGLVLAFLHSPELVVLDEPFAHLDESGEREVQSLIEESRASGATVFLTDPVPSAVEGICDRVATLRRGRLVNGLGADGLALRS